MTCRWPRILGPVGEGGTDSSPRLGTTTTRSLPSCRSPRGTMADPRLLQARAETVGVRRWCGSGFRLGGDSTTARRRQPNNAHEHLRRIRLPGLETPSCSFGQSWNVELQTGARAQQRAPHQLRLTEIHVRSCRDPLVPICGVAVRAVPASRRPEQALCVKPLADGLRRFVCPCGPEQDHGVAPPR